MGGVGDVALHSLGTDSLAGARGSSFPTSLGDPPRPPNRTDSTYQSPRSHSLPLPPPPPCLSAELLELGDSLMKLGNITTPYDLDARTQEQHCSQHIYSHITQTAPYSIEPSYSSCSHRQDQNAPTTPYVLDHITITEPCHGSKEQGYCHSTGYSAEVECIQNLVQPSSYRQEYAATYDRTIKPDSSYDPCSQHSSSNTQEHPAACALDRLPKSDRQPPAQLCLLSPELEPELLLSPVIPPGGPFSPSDPQSLESLDPTASAQLLDNIMAWFNNNINPQNNPQSLALIPSPPTTESDSSPDTHTETESKSQTSREATPAPIWQPPEGSPDMDSRSASPCPGAVGAEGTKTSRPDSQDMENREVDEEGVDVGCVANLSLDEAYTHPSSHSQQGNSPAHTGTVAERDLELRLQLEADQSPEDWEQQVHLV